MSGGATARAASSESLVGWTRGAGLLLRMRQMKDGARSARRVSGFMPAPPRRAPWAWFWLARREGRSAVDLCWSWEAMKFAHAISVCMHTPRLQVPCSSAVHLGSWALVVAAQQAGRDVHLQRRRVRQVRVIRRCERPAGHFDTPCLLGSAATLWCSSALNINLTSSLWENV